MLDIKTQTYFDYASPAYAELYAASDATAFQHPQWQQAMQRHIERLQDIESKVLTVHERSTGRLLCVLPLVSRPLMGAEVLEYANLGLVDYALPTIHPDLWSLLPSIGQVSHQLEEALGSYDLLRIKHLRSNNPNLLRLFPHGQMRKADFCSHATELDSDFETWRANAMSAKTRKSNNKKRRAMNRAGEISFSCLTDADEIEVAFSYLKKFRHTRFEDRNEKDYAQDEAAFSFYLDLAKSGAQTGFTHTYQFTMDGEIVGVHFGLADQGRFYYLLPAINYEKLSKFSPGLLMAEDMIEDCIKRGFSVFDFTVGDESHKQKFNTKSTDIYTLWHGHSMLGNMGVTFAKVLHKGGMAHHVTRWLSPENKK